MVKKSGRADIDFFLQNNWQKPGVEKKLKTIDYADEKQAIHALEQLMKIFDQKSNYDNNGEQDELDNKSKSSEDLINMELLQLPNEYDRSLELVCWMDIM